MNTLLSNRVRLQAQGHLQTLAVLLPVCPGELPPHTLEDVHVPVEEGALLARTHWLPGSRPLVILLHGVAGTSENPYMRRAAASLLSGRSWSCSLDFAPTESADCAPTPRS